MITTIGFTAAAKDLVLGLDVPDCLSIYVFGFALHTNDSTRVVKAKPVPPGYTMQNAAPSDPTLSEISDRIADWTDSRTQRFRNFSLRDIMQKTGLNVRQVKLYLHSRRTNFRQWNLNLRIEEAKRLLLEDQFSTIEDIAKRTGFNSKPNFFRRFRQIVGVTPKKWKDDYL